MDNTVVIGFAGGTSNYRLTNLPETYLLEVTSEGDGGLWTQIDTFSTPQEAWLYVGERLGWVQPIVEVP